MFSTDIQSSITIRASLCLHWLWVWWVSLMVAIQSMLLFNWFWWLTWRCHIREYGSFHLYCFIVHVVRSSNPNHVYVTYGERILLVLQFVSETHIRSSMNTSGHCRIQLSGVLPNPSHVVGMKAVSIAATSSFVSYLRYCQSVTRN
jgi:hypothetical protein